MNKRIVIIGEVQYIEQYLINKLKDYLPLNTHAYHKYLNKLIELGYNDKAKYYELHTTEPSQKDYKKITFIMGYWGRMESLAVIVRSKISNSYGYMEDVGVLNLFTIYANWKVDGEREVLLIGTSKDGRVYYTNSYVIFCNNIWQPIDDYEFKDYSSHYYLENGIPE